MGSVTLKSRDGGTCKVEMYACNALTIFIHHFKEDGQKMHNVWNFFGDKKHALACMKGEKNICGVEVVKAELNMFWGADSKTLLDIFTKKGIKVTCYYKEIK